jgi:outer membrane protein TolC/MFS family permease
MPEALRSLRHRDYRLYFSGQFVSMVGTWMQVTAQSWLVYRLTGSGALLGLVAAAGQAPSLVLGLAGGAAADRFDRRRLLVVTQILSLLQAAVLAWLTLTGRVQVWHVFALSVMLGIVNIFDMPARQAFVPQLVPREDMGNAIALSGILLNMSRLIGPAAAGLLIARSGESSCFVLNAVSYVAVVISLLMIRAKPVEARVGSAGELARIREGLRYCFEDPERRSILLLLAGVSVAGMPAMMLLPVYSEGILHAGPTGFGFLTTAFAVGALLASAMLARRAEPDELPAVVGKAAAFFGAAIAVLAALRGFGPACCAMFAAGWGMMTCFSGGNIRLQDRSSDAMRGRVMGLFSMTFTATAPFGMLAMGWASDRFGAPAALAAGGLVSAAGGLAFLAARPQARRAAAAGLAAALLLAAGARPARAESKPLTWEQCEALAADSNPDLAASRFSLEASFASFYQSINGVMPQVNLTNSLNEGSVMPVNRWSAQATASMNLINAVQINNIRAASAATSLNEANLRKASADLRQTLRFAFSHLLFAQESLKVSRLISSLREHDAEMIGLRYNSGTEAKGDKLLADAQTMQARLSIVAAERDVRAAQRELAQRLGRETYEDFVASGTLGAAAPPSRPEDLTPLLLLQPEVLIAEASQRQAKVGVSQAESALWPSLSGNYSRSRTDRVEFPSANYAWGAGLTLSYPLFGAGPTSTWYGTKAAKRSLDASGRSLQSVRVSGLTTLESTWASYADAVDQVQVQQALLAADRQRNDEADVEYASGLLIYANWEQIASSRISEESQVISALKSAMDAETSWNRALGRALGE